MSQLLDALRRERGHAASRGGREADETENAVIASLASSGSRWRRRAAADRRGRALVAICAAATITFAAAFFVLRARFDGGSGVVPVPAGEHREAGTGGPALPPGPEPVVTPHKTASAGGAEASRPSTTEVGVDPPAAAKPLTAETSADDRPPLRAPRRSSAVRPRRAAAEASRASATAAAPSTPAPATPPDHARLASFYHRSGDFERALLHYRALLERDPLNVQAHNDLGLLYQEKGLFGDAVAEFQKALAIDAKNARARNNLGVSLLKMNRIEQALVEFRALVAANSRDVDALVNLALALDAGGQRGMAQETLMRAIGVDFRTAAAHYNLALLYEEDKEFGKALTHYADFLQFAGADHAALVPAVRQRVAALEARTDVR